SSSWRCQWWCRRPRRSGPGWRTTSFRRRWCRMAWPRGRCSSPGCLNRRSTAVVSSAFLPIDGHRTEDREEKARLWPSLRPLDSHKYDLRRMSIPGLAHAEGNAVEGKVIAASDFRGDLCGPASCVGRPRGAAGTSGVGGGAVFAVPALLLRELRLHAVVRDVGVLDSLGFGALGGPVEAPLLALVRRDPLPHEHDRDEEAGNFPERPRDAAGD